MSAHGRGRPRRLLTGLLATALAAALAAGGLTATASAEPDGAGGGAPEVISHTYHCFWPLIGGDQVTLTYDEVTGPDEVAGGEAADFALSGVLRLGPRATTGARMFGHSVDGTALLDTTVHTPEGSHQVPVKLTLGSARLTGDDAPEEAELPILFSDLPTLTVPGPGPVTWTSADVRLRLTVRDRDGYDTGLDLFEPECAPDPADQDLALSPRTPAPHEPEDQRPPEGGLLLDHTCENDAGGPDEVRLWIGTASLPETVTIGEPRPTDPDPGLSDGTSIAFPAALGLSASVTQRLRELGHTRVSGILGLTLRTESPDGTHGSFVHSFTVPAAPLAESGETWVGLWPQDRRWWPLTTPGTAVLAADGMELALRGGPGDPAPGDPPACGLVPGGQDGTLAVIEVIPWEREVVEQTYALSGALTIAAAGTAVDLTGTGAARITPPFAGDPYGGYGFHIAARLEESGLPLRLGLFPLRLTVAAEPSRELRGHYDVTDGGLHLSTEVGLRVTSASVLGLPLITGQDCRTRTSSPLHLHGYASEDGPLRGSFALTQDRTFDPFTIDEFTGCGPLDRFVSSLLSGDGNTVDLTLTPGTG